MTKIYQEIKGLVKGSESTKNKPQKYYENYRRHEKIYHVHIGKIK